MKLSQFKKIEKEALQQKATLKIGIEKAEACGNMIAATGLKENLNNLVETMRGLKNK